MLQLHANNDHRYLYALFPVAVFALLSLIEIELPGLYMDEAFLDAYVVKILDSSKIEGRPLFGLPDNVLDKHSRFPLTAAEFHAGILGTYLGLPFYKIFGMNFISLRVYHALYGGIIVFLTYLLLNRFVRRSLACWGSVLLAVDISFLVSFRTQAWNVVHPLPFFLGALLLIFPLKDDKLILSKIRTFSAGILLGLSCYGYFVYWLLALPLVITLLFLYRERFTLKATMTGLLGCFLGSLPLWYAILSVAINAPDAISRTFERTSSNWGFGQRIDYMHNLIAVLFRGENVPQYVAGMHAVSVSWMKTCAWLFAGICLFAIFFIHGGSRLKRFIFLCVFMLFLFFMESLRFSNRMATHHLVILLPFAVIALTGMIEMLLSGMKNRTNDAGTPCLASYFPAGELSGPGANQETAAKANGIYMKYLAYLLLAIFTLIVIPINLLQFRAFTNKLVEKGGIYLRSNAINSLADYLLTHHKDDLIVYCDWGYMLPCHFLTRGYIHHHYYIGNNQEERKRIIKHLFDHNDNITFVLPIPPPKPELLTAEEIEKIRTIISHTARIDSSSKTSSMIFNQRDGVPVVEAISFSKHRSTH